MIAAIRISLSASEAVAWALSLLTAGAGLCALLRLRWTR